MAAKKPPSPAKRTATVEHVRAALGNGVVSERRAGRVPGVPRSTQRREAHAPDDEPALVRRMVELATEYGRYGFRRVAVMPRAEGLASTTSGWSGRGGVRD